MAGRSWVDAVVGPAGVTAAWRGESCFHVWYCVVGLLVVWILLEHKGRDCNHYQK